MKGLDVFLERDRDRELFDLPNNVKGGAKLGHCGGVKVDRLRRDDSLSKAAVSGAGTQSGDAW